MSNGRGWATASRRFWSKVNRNTESGCWLWTSPSLRNGYGYFAVAESEGRMAHRFAYEQLVGPIPDGLTLDHLCRVRACVNPAHLEAVTMSENRRRVPLKPACGNGHEYTPENTYYPPSGGRHCRICTRWHIDNYQARQRLKNQELVQSERASAR